MAITGEQCEQSGLYFVSGACGHSAERAVRRRERHGHCPVCGRPANWTLLREYLACPEETGANCGTRLYAFAR